MFKEDVREAKWTLEAEVELGGRLVARLGYAQMPNGWLVEAGGWGGRNNLEIVKHSLINLQGALDDAAIHSTQDGKGGMNTYWAAVKRKLYVMDQAKPPHSGFGDTQ